MAIEQQRPVEESRPNRGKATDDPGARPKGSRTGDGLAQPGIDLTFALDGPSPGDAMYHLCQARSTLGAGGTLRIHGIESQQRADIIDLAIRAGLDPADPAASGPLCLTKPMPAADEPPLVSVVVPAYSPTFFEPCLTSAIEQTYRDMEIIVCDDSAGDEIERITARLSRRRPIIYLRNQQRLQQRGNYARCFERASGALIKYLNDDDILMPSCVEQMANAFRQVPDLVLATSYRQRIDDAGQTLDDQPATRPLASADQIVQGISLANVMIMAGLNVVGEPTTVMFRKRALLRAMPNHFRFEHDANLGITDMSMWFHLLLQGDAVYFRQALSRYRIHSGQLQNQSGVRAVSIPNIRNLQERWLTLGLHRHLPRYALNAKRFPQSDLPWQELPLPHLPRPPERRSWGFC